MKIKIEMSDPFISPDDSDEWFQQIIKTVTEQLTQFSLYLDILLREAFDLTENVPANRSDDIYTIYEMRISFRDLYIKFSSCIEKLKQQLAKDDVYLQKTPREEARFEICLKKIEYWYGILIQLQNYQLCNTNVETEFQIIRDRIQLIQPINQPIKSNVLMSTYRINYNGQPIEQIINNTVNKTYNEFAKKQLAAYQQLQVENNANVISVISDKVSEQVTNRINNTLVSTIESVVSKYPSTTTTDLNEQINSVKDAYQSIQAELELVSNEFTSIKKQPQLNDFDLESEPEFEYDDEVPTSMQQSSNLNDYEYNRLLDEILSLKNDVITNASIEKNLNILNDSITNQLDRLRDDVSAIRNQQEDVDDVVRSQTKFLLETNTRINNAVKTLSDQESNTINAIRQVALDTTKAINSINLNAALNDYRKQTQADIDTLNENLNRIVELVDRQTRNSQRNEDILANYVRELEVISTSFSRIQDTLIEDLTNLIRTNVNELFSSLDVRLTGYIEQITLQLVQYSTQTTGDLRQELETYVQQVSDALDDKIPKEKLNKIVIEIEEINDNLRSNKNDLERAFNDLNRLSGFVRKRRDDVDATQISSIKRRKLSTTVEE